jgi:hypothetical protein
MGNNLRVAYFVFVFPSLGYQIRLVPKTSLREIMCDNQIAYV